MVLLLHDMFLCVFAHAGMQALQTEPEKKKKNMKSAVAEVRIMLYVSCYPFVRNLCAAVSYYATLYNAPDMMLP